MKIIKIIRKEKSKKKPKREKDRTRSETRSKGEGRKRRRGVQPHNFRKREPQSQSVCILEY